MDGPDTSQQALSRIKEILFGDELQGLDARLSDLKNELMAVVENQVKTLEEKLAGQQQDFNSQIKSLKAKIENETEKTGRLGSALQEVNTRLKEIAEQAEKQHEENKAALTALKKEWMDIAGKLDKTKVNKTEIAELFGLMIQKLK